MNKTMKWTGGAVLAAAACAAQAAVVFTTPSLTGFTSYTGFADGTPRTFSAVYRDLQGSVSGQTLAGANVDVSLQGAFSFTGHSGPGGTIADPGAAAVAIFGGLLASTLPVGPYDFTFEAGTLGQNDTEKGSRSFTVDYDGKTSAQLMGLLASLTGLPFADPTGSGTLSVNATLFSDGLKLDFTESNLTWSGYGKILYAADYVAGGRNGVIDGPFALRDFSVAAEVPEPASLALAGLALAGAAAASRRRRKS